MKKPDRLFSKSIGRGAERTKGRSHKVLSDTKEPRFELLPETNHRAAVPPAARPAVADEGFARVMNEARYAVGVDDQPSHGR